MAGSGTGAVTFQLNSFSSVLYAVYMQWVLGYAQWLLYV